MKVLKIGLGLLLFFSLSSLVASEGTLDKIADSVASNEEEFLQPDEAFQLNVQPIRDNTLQIEWQIAEGYYLYRDKIQAQIESTDIFLGTLELPKGKEKVDEYFGKVEIYEHEVIVRAPLSGAGLRSQNSLNVIVQYQGCATAVLCYPPISKTVAVDVDPNANASISATRNNNLSATEPVQSEQDRIASTLASGKMWLTIATFFGFGLLLAFTPCVFPMIPILSSIIVGHGGSASTRHAFLVSLIYVLAMAVTYAAAGVFVGWSGENVQVWFQNPWVLSVFALIFVLLAFSMFGFYQLQMPSAIQSKLATLSSSQKQGSLIGVAIMGFLSALIVGPCVTAPLIGALIYIADTGDAVTGGVALFALSMGMGAPILAIGTSAGKVLPKAGKWMDAVKAVFGVLLLALAIWMLDRFLPRSIILALASALLIVSAIYMGALDGLGEKSSGWNKLWKGVGLISLVYGTLLLIGAASGSHSFIRPLDTLAFNGRAGGESHEAGLAFQPVKGVDGLFSAVESAAAQGKPVMIDFYADWCVSCKELEATTFVDKKVLAALEDFVLLQADVTKNDEQDQGLLKQLGIVGPPAILFYDPSGDEAKNFRVVGYKNGTDFAAHIGRFKKSSIIVADQ